MDAAGVIADLNEPARLLLPAGAGTALADAAPAWLADAHRGLGARWPADAPGGGGATAPHGRGMIGDRSYEAHAVPAGEDPGGSGLTYWWLFDVTGHRTLARELEIERERTAFLAEASSMLLASLNLDRCMEVTARLAARHLAEAAFVIAPRAGHGHTVVSCGPGGEPVREELRVDPAEMPGLAEALQGFPPVPSRWIDPAAAPGWVTERSFDEPGAMVVTALPGHGVAAGALVLVRGRGREAFSPGEEVVARLFAARAGAAMSAARLYAEQASITETLMRELLPPRAQELDGAEVAARYRPSGDGERVGGDFYDLYPAASGAGADAESLAVLGDVCGKGLEAAVLTGKIRHTLRALLPLADDHQRMLDLLNATLLHGDSTRFVTLVLASVRRAGDGVRLRLTSAGHAPPLIVRADGTVAPAETRGSLIGVLDAVPCTTATVLLEPGDACLLYTDGITEAVGGPLGDEMFGDDRLCEELARCGGMPPEALVERVHMLAAQWVGGGHHDDMAMVALAAPRRPRPGARGPRPGGAAQ